MHLQPTDLLSFSSCASGEFEGLPGTQVRDYIPFHLEVKFEPKQNFLEA